MGGHETSATAHESLFERRGRAVHPTRYRQRSTTPARRRCLRPSRVFGGPSRPGFLEGPGGYPARDIATHPPKPEGPVSPSPSWTGWRVTRSRLRHPGYNPPTAAPSVGGDGGGNAVAAHRPCPKRYHLRRIDTTLPSSIETTDSGSISHEPSPPDRTESVVPILDRTVESSADRDITHWQRDHPPAARRLTSPPNQTTVHPYRLEPQRTER